MNKIAIKDDVKIEDMIFEVRGKQVIFASDIARLYNSETKVINQVVKRNKNRFPEEFCFQLTEKELDEIRSRSQFVTLNIQNNSRGHNVKYLPYVFTEQGVAMLSALLKSDIAVTTSIKIINAFVAMRKYISNNLLEINIQSDQIPKEDLSQVLQQYRRKKKYYRLKNGELLFLDSPELEELDQLLEEYHVEVKDIHKGKVQLSSNRALSLDEKEFENIQVKRDKTFNQFVDSFNNQQVPFVLDEHYQNILRDYQKEGVQWLKTLQDYSILQAHVL